MTMRKEHLIERDKSEKSNSFYEASTRFHILLIDNHLLFLMSIYIIISLVV